MPLLPPLYIHVYFRLCSALWEVDQGVIQKNFVRKNHCRKCSNFHFFLFRSNFPGLNLVCIRPFSLKNGTCPLYPVSQDEIIRRWERLHEIFVNKIAKSNFWSTKSKKWQFNFFFLLFCLLVSDFFLRVCFDYQLVHRDQKVNFSSPISNFSVVITKNSNFIHTHPSGLNEEEHIGDQKEG